MKKMLLLSSSSYKDTGYLVHSKDWISNFLDKNGVLKDEVLFIPFAGVRRTNDEYEKKVSDCLKDLNIKSIHHYADKKTAIKNAKIISVGGGNTFMLLHELYKFDLVDEIREAVENGALYFGWSAGANIAGKTIMTTNDMPIIMPKSFDSLNLFTKQINPHFISGKISGHNGESREERLEEFLIANPNSEVFGLFEGAGFEVYGNEATVIGNSGAIKFIYNKESKKMSQEILPQGSKFTF